MKTILLLLFVVALEGGAGLAVARAAATRTQVIPIRAGWNAVFLEVQPAAASPGEVFAGLPVEAVACFIPGRLEAQYLRDPGDAPWREEGWAVWHAPARAEAFLSNLFEIQAQRALLVRASADFDWTVTGEVRATVLEWHPNACTLTGLPVDPAAPPTFAQFFEGSPAHRRLRIFRLEAGNWKLVRNPGAERVRNGEAYWIETDGASRYQGPLRVRFPAPGELDFDRRSGGYPLEVTNDSGTRSLRVRIEVAGGGDTLPLRQVSRDLSRRATTRGPLPAAIDLPLLVPGKSVTLRLEPHRDAMPSASGATLLRVTGDQGTQFWLPVRARKDARGGALDNP